MRRSLILVAVGLVAGCQSKPAAEIPSRPVYIDRPSASLVFDPPVMRGQPAAFLDRGIREAGAFVGYEDLSTTYFYVQTDDRPGDSNSGWMYRRAVTERVGVSYR